MNWWRRIPIREGTLVAAGTLVASLAVAAFPVPLALAVGLPPVVAGLLAGWRSARSIAHAERRQVALAAELAAASTRIASMETARSQLCHDLRGILSPALLTADRLTTSADPLSRRAGETMVSTVERVNERLSRPN